jgi:uncharacterized protein
MKKLLFLILFPLFLTAESLPSKPSDYITDECKVIDDLHLKMLNGKLGRFEKETSNQIFVYITPSLNGNDMSQFCQQLFEYWEIGTKKNNGVLIAIFLNDHKFRIHTGYGLEGVLPDLLTKRIQENEMVPKFKEKDYYMGIRNGIDKLIYYTKNEYKPEDIEEVKAYEHKISPGAYAAGAVPAYLLNVIILFVALYQIYLGKGKNILSSSRKGRMMLATLGFSLIPIIGAILVIRMLAKAGIAASDGGDFSGGSGGGSGSSYSSGNSRSSSSSSSSGFSGGKGGRSGGGGSNSSW